MSDKKQKDVQPEKKTDQERISEFVDAYNALTNTYGFQIVASPAWIKRDDGSYSLVVQYSVGKISKQ